MTVEEYLKAKRKAKIKHYIILSLRILLFVGTILFILSFSKNEKLSWLLSGYRELITTTPFILALVVLFYIYRFIHEIDPENKKVKHDNYIKKLEKSLEANDLKDFEPYNGIIPDSPFSMIESNTYENLGRAYSAIIKKNWFNFYIKRSIDNFWSKGLLTFYSLASFEDKIKENWEQYKGKTVCTIGFAYSAPYGSFLFVAYPLHEFSKTDIMDDYFTIYETTINQKTVYIKNHHLVLFTSDAKLRNAYLNMQTKAFIQSKWRLIEHDPGTRVYLIGELDMDENGNFILTNNRIEKCDNQYRDIPESYNQNTLTNETKKD